MSQILCGPILRKTDAQQLILWWVSDTPCEGHFYCYKDNKQLLRVKLTSDALKEFKIGSHAYVYLLEIEHSLPTDCIIEYDLALKGLLSESGYHLKQYQPDICYDGQNRCSFIIKTQLNNLLHGSCRNPHHSGDDSLIAGDNKLASTVTNHLQRPSLLMLSGDQIYADHVAGPMLYAIHKVIKRLGLNTECLPDMSLENASHIMGEDPNYYQRKAFLPLTKTTKYWRNNQQESIFTGDYVHNHLVTFSEVCAMYLLIWSPKLWQDIDLDQMPKSNTHLAEQQNELKHISNFVAGLGQVRRLLANVSCYMIFDDHDVTDDWNLSAKWEQSAYQNPLAKRILGNALFGYWLFQGWGNCPNNFNSEFIASALQYQQQPIDKTHGEFIDVLFKFNHWHYEINSSPKMIVLDCRTQRWRSENNLKSPSGLMDWEALSTLQQQLIGESAVILVSPAPIFGVKLIEAIQRLATILGQPLAVDAENWMAHPGSANTILNIFRHPKTPQHFVILSGDVHYSFVCDIHLRFRENSQKIWQITSSGIKNQFPSKLIHILDTLNRYFYSIHSPLNWFTKRRDMAVDFRYTKQHNKRQLIENSGLGYLELNSDGSPSRIIDLHTNGKVTEFIHEDS